jgi:hypothetical protein
MTELLLHLKHEGKKWCKKVEMPGRPCSNRLSFLKLMFTKNNGEVQYQEVAVDGELPMTEGFSYLEYKIRLLEKVSDDSLVYSGWNSED